MDDPFKCTCVTAGLITACVRHDTIIFPEPFPVLFDVIPSLNRVVTASAHLSATKAAPAVPFSGPPGDLFALTRLIDTQPTTEQWQTLKRLILSLERT